MVLGAYVRYGEVKQEKKTLADPPELARRIDAPPSPRVDDF